jgi:hypothetical protein
MNFPASSPAARAAAVPAAVTRIGHAQGNDRRHSGSFSRDHHSRRARSFSAVTVRRFLPPWSIEDIGACFVVKDASVHLLRRHRTRK